MNTRGPWIIHFERDHPRWRLSTQRAAMAAAGGSDRAMSDQHALLKDIRQTDIIAVYRLFLLAEPAKKYQRGGMRASLYKAIDTIEEKGGTLWEIETGRKTSDKRQREAMIRDAIEDMARTRKHAAVGRPKKVFSEEQLVIAEMHWFSAKHASNHAAVAAIQAAGVKMGAKRAYDTFGSSGRAAGNPLHRAAREKARAEMKRTAVVYFIQRDPPLGPIKIGHAVDVSKRMMSIQNGSAERLKLLGTKPGGREKEKQLHHRFASLRMSGEWFACKGALATFVKKLEKN